MFCYKCGKENAEQSTFCTWCGAKLDIGVSSVPTPSVIPQSNLHEQPVQSIPLPEENQSPIPTETSPEMNTVPAPEQPIESENTVPQPQPEQPEQPETVPVSEQEQSLRSTGQSNAIPLNIPAGGKAEAPAKPRKYYTGAHMALCLVVMGILAAASGIFAGLYFSVIL